MFLYAKNDVQMIQVQLFYQHYFLRINAVVWRRNLFQPLTQPGQNIPMRSASVSTHFNSSHEKSLRLAVSKQAEHTNEEYLNKQNIPMRSASVPSLPRRWCSPTITSPPLLTPLKRDVPSTTTC
uniref:Uncharacterized protein n=1 Tax=Cacopsylla melanoneura TaxID=428564 RepID=A0A8D8VDL6_9HEMI